MAAASQPVHLFVGEVTAVHHPTKSGNFRLTFRPDQSNATLHCIFYADGRNNQTGEDAQREAEKARSQSAFRGQLQFKNTSDSSSDQEIIQITAVLRPVDPTPAGAAPAAAAAVLVADGVAAELQAVLDAARASEWQQESDPQDESNGAAFSHKDFMNKDEFLQFMTNISPPGSSLVSNLTANWDAVLKITGSGKFHQGSQPASWSGTGWLLSAPGLVVRDAGGEANTYSARWPLVVTNRHVYNDAKCKDIALKAVFETPSGPVEFELDSVSQFIAAQVDAGKYPSLKLNQLDFVILKFKVPASAANEERLTALTRHSLRWEEGGRIQSLPKGQILAVIIGHPRGGDKKGSIGNLRSDYNAADEKFGFTGQYEQSKSRPGNSGSPVFFIDGKQLSAHTVGALHYASGLGVMFMGLGPSIRAQFADVTRVREVSLREYQDNRDLQNYFRP